MTEKSIWQGEVGDDYIRRNQTFPDRHKFWDKVITAYRPRNVLEVGCNIGFNVAQIKHLEKQLEVWGVDVNERAVRILHSTQPDINGGWANIFRLPFKDNLFDLAFTCGVLIHIKPKDLEEAISEVWRVTRENMLLAEYFAQDMQEIAWHGRKQALFKGPYGDIAASVTGRQPEATGYLSKDDGFDRVTWWVFKK